jgi:hypothetical protein
MALAAGISVWRGPRSNPFLRDRVAATRGPLFIPLMAAGYRRSLAAANQPTSPPRSNPISGANGTPAVMLPRIPSSKPRAPPMTTGRMRLRSLAVTERSPS